MWRRGRGLDSDLVVGAAEVVVAEVSGVLPVLGICEELGVLRDRAVDDNSVATVQRAAGLRPDCRCRPCRRRRDLGRITTSASSASAIATSVRSSGFAGAVNSRRTLAGFFPISRASSAFVMPFVVRNESSSFTIASIALISRLARSNSARNSGSFI
jgi:hypothetical protein